jgi:hypothetical protein
MAWQFAEKAGGEPAFQFLLWECLSDDPRCYVSCMHLPAATVS